MLEKKLKRQFLTEPMTLFRAAAAFRAAMPFYCLLFSPPSHLRVSLFCQVLLFAERRASRIPHAVPIFSGTMLFATVTESIIAALFDGHI